MLTNPFIESKDNFETFEDYIKAGTNSNWGYPEITPMALDKLVRELNWSYCIVAPDEWLERYRDVLPPNINRTGVGRLLATLVPATFRANPSLCCLEVRQAHQHQGVVMVSKPILDKSDGLYADHYFARYDIWDGVERQIRDFLISRR